MPGPKLIVTSQGTFRGLKSLASLVGKKPENIKRLVLVNAAADTWRRRDDVDTPAELLEFAARSSTNGVSGRTGRVR